MAETKVKPEDLAARIRRDLARGYHIHIVLEDGGGPYDVSHSDVVFYVEKALEIASIQDGGYIERVLEARNRPYHRGYRTVTYTPTPGSGGDGMFAFVDRVSQQLRMHILLRDRENARIAELEASRIGGAPVPIADILEAVRKMPSVIVVVGPGEVTPSGVSANSSIIVEFLPILFNGSQMRDRYILKNSYSMTTPVVFRLSPTGRIGGPGTMHPHVSGDVCRGNGEEAFQALIDRNRPIELIGLLSKFVLGINPGSQLSSGWTYDGWESLYRYNTPDRKRVEGTWDGETVQYSLTGEIAPISKWFPQAKDQASRLSLANEGMPRCWLPGEAPPATCSRCGAATFKCSQCSEMHCSRCGRTEGRCRCGEAVGSRELDEDDDD